MVPNVYPPSEQSCNLFNWKYLNRKLLFIRQFYGNECITEYFKH